MEEGAVVLSGQQQKCHSGQDEQRMSMGTKRQRDGGRGKKKKKRGRADGSAPEGVKGENGGNGGRGTGDGGRVYCGDGQRRVWRKGGGPVDAGRVSRPCGGSVSSRQKDEAATTNTPFWGSLSQWQTTTARARAESSPAWWTAMLLGMLRRLLHSTQPATWCERRGKWALARKTAEAAL